VRPLRLYLTLFLAWTSVGLFFLSQDVARRYFFGDAQPWREATYWMVRVYVSAAFTPFILWLGRRWPIERPKRFVRSVEHLLAGGGFAVVEVAVETAVLLRVGDLAALSLFGSYRRSVAILLIFGFHANLISYWVVLGIQSGFRYYWKYQEREQHALRLELHASELKAQLADAHVSALKMQLQPHFLFNTLNAIMVLVRQQRGREAEETLARFSDLLRAVLSDMDAQEVALSRELEYLRLYLSIEQVRFSDRLQVEIEANPEILDAAVPHMGLQPIVENAVRHGIAKSAAAGFIRIGASRVNDQLEITVTDNGSGIPASGAEHKGIGLSNTRARLRQLYGDTATLTIVPGERGGTTVVMSIPFHPAPAISETCATDDLHEDSF
jgi:two-component system, LytTR family, sensor kinase